MQLQLTPEQEQKLHEFSAKAQVKAEQVSQKAQDFAHDVKERAEKLVHKAGEKMSEIPTREMVRDAGCMGALVGGVICALLSRRGRRA